MKFPAPLEAWVVSCEQKQVFNNIVGIEFPSPLEVWVGSYTIKASKAPAFKAFPSPLEDWMVSYYQFR